MNKLKQINEQFYSNFIYIFYDFYGNEFIHRSNWVHKYVFMYIHVEMLII